MGKAKINFNYKVLIASAGLGNRLKGMTKNVNKALISVAHKPAIAYIVEKFPDEIEFVIALGYKGDSVKEYLKIAFPSKKFNFVDVDKYQGNGSGLGYSILKCQKELQCPFIFSSNDTIVLENIPKPDKNWMGQTNLDDNSIYRTLDSKGGVVKEINKKGASADSPTYIGLAGVYDYKVFWESMNEGINQGSIEIGESFGLRNLIEKGISTVDFTWFDTGNIDSLNATRDFFSKSIDYNILEKEEEAIWFQNNVVIKFSTDKKFIKNRVLRADSLNGFIPKVISSSPNMYAYKKVEGEVFSKHANPKNFKFLLTWLNSFWQLKKLNKHENESFFDATNKFYKNKTYDRVKNYFLNLETFDTDEIINGVHTPKVYELLDKINWQNICDGTPCRFHGDLHFENILINKENKPQFTLLDWRQDFNGNLEFGDIYYDFAKINHGLIISHGLIEKDLFTVDDNMGIINFDFNRTQNLIDCEDYFYTWLTEKGYDVHKVKVMTSLIFLNIACLHHYPYNKLLFYLGKSMLNKLL